MSTRICLEFSLQEVLKVSRATRFPGGMETEFTRKTAKLIGELAGFTVKCREEEYDREQLLGAFIRGVFG